MPYSTWGAPWPFLFFLKHLTLWPGLEVHLLNQGTFCLADFSWALSPCIKAPRAASSPLLFSPSSREDLHRHPRHHGNGLQEAGL